MPVTSAQQLKDHAERAIAARRAEKAEYFARLLFLSSIKADDMRRAQEWEWEQLGKAAEEDGKTYGAPGAVTREAILRRLRELEAANAHVGLVLA